LQFSNRYIIGFSIAVCLVCSVQKLERQINILSVSELIGPKDSPNAQEAAELFSQIEPVIIDRKTGRPDPNFPNPGDYDPIAAARDPKQSKAVPPNDAKVQRLPDKIVVYRVTTPGKQALILPIQGAGLWSTLYGFLALEDDFVTIKGLTYYQHGETPGLGGEVDNPAWKAQWKGKKAFRDGVPAIRVRKGKATSEYEVDGLSGATLTANGVTAMLRFWLGDEGYGRFLKKGMEKSDG